MIITLCGSSRFEPWFHAWNQALSLSGHVVSTRRGKELVVLRGRQDRSRYCPQGQDRHEPRHLSTECLRVHWREHSQRDRARAGSSQVYLFPRELGTRERHQRFTLRILPQECLGDVQSTARIWISNRHVGDVYTPGAVGSPSSCRTTAQQHRSRSKAYPFSVWKRILV
jgi:hypothetical protein